VEFEWDDRKRQVNLEKHDVDFRDLPSVFQHPHLTYLSLKESPREGERRQVAVGRLRPPGSRPESWSGPLVAVVYVRREGTYRIISARRARSNERRAYDLIYG
jgi:hypothetical protein